MNAIKTILLGIAFLLLAMYCGYVGIAGNAGGLALCSMVLALVGIIIAIVGACKKD